VRLYAEYICVLYRTCRVGLKQRTIKSDDLRLLVVDRAHYHGLPFAHTDEGSGP